MKHRAGSCLIWTLCHPARVLGTLTAISVGCLLYAVRATDALLELGDAEDIPLDT